LKKKENPVYSKIAGDTITKWKQLCKEEMSSSLNVSSGLENKLKSPKKEALNAKKPIAASTSEVDLNARKALNGTSHTNGNANFKSSKSQTVLNQPNDTNKKRPPAAPIPETNGKPNGNSEGISPKKQKLSFNDYKLKKDTGDNLSDDSSSSSDNKYKPTAISQDKRDDYKPSVDKAKPSMITVPKPTEPLPIKITGSSYSSGAPYSSYGSISNTFQRDLDAENSAALDTVFKSKHSKKMLYTGRKTNKANGPQEVPKLFDMCVRTLTETLDDLANRISIYNTNNDFPVAFDLIKPVLEKANAKQLQHVEYYSPNLQEDTNYIWKRVCEQEFKNEKFDDEDEYDEMTDWKELYLKKVREREEKFENVRNRLSQSQANKPKAKQTQMATVKFVSSTRSTTSSSMGSSKQSAIAKLKSSSSSAPVRAIIKDEPGFKRGSCWSALNVWVGFRLFFV
jgi:hypothetical protein